MGDNASEENMVSRLKSIAEVDYDTSSCIRDASNASLLPKVTLELLPRQAFIDPALVSLQQPQSAYPASEGSALGQLGKVLGLEKKVSSPTTSTNHKKRPAVDDRVVESLKQRIQQLAPNYNDYADVDVAKIPDVETGATRKGPAPTFHIALHRMLEAAESSGYADVVSWQDHGRAFNVRDKARFVAEVVPLHFKQKTWGSFLRQLSNYGFTRISSQSHKDLGCYYHELFLRGRPELCSRMQRGAPVSGKSAAAASDLSFFAAPIIADPDFYSMPAAGLLPPSQNPNKRARSDSELVVASHRDSQRMIRVRTASTVGTETRASGKHVESPMDALASRFHQSDDWPRQDLTRQGEAMVGLSGLNSNEPIEALRQSWPGADPSQRRALAIDRSLHEAACLATSFAFPTRLEEKFPTKRVESGGNGRDPSELSFEECAETVAFLVDVEFSDTEE